ncbi:hypothetical protein Tco_1447121 [Tanacetum coccineum]
MKISLLRTQTLRCGANNENMKDKELEDARGKRSCVYNMWMWVWFPKLLKVLILIVNHGDDAPGKTRSNRRTTRHLKKVKGVTLIFKLKSYPDTQKIADVAAGTAVIGYNMEDLESLILTVEQAIGRSSFFDVRQLTISPHRWRFARKIQIEEEADFGRGKGQRKVGSFREAYAPKPMDTLEKTDDKQKDEAPEKIIVEDTHKQEEKDENAPADTKENPEKDDALQKRISSPCFIYLLILRTHRRHTYISTKFAVIVLLLIMKTKRKLLPKCGIVGRVGKMGVLGTGSYSLCDSQGGPTVVGNLGYYSPWKFNCCGKFRTYELLDGGVSHSAIGNRMNLTGVGTSGILENIYPPVSDNFLDAAGDSIMHDTNPFGRTEYSGSLLSQSRKRPLDSRLMIDVVDVIWGHVSVPVVSLTTDCATSAPKRLRVDSYHRRIDSSVPSQRLMSSEGCPTPLFGTSTGVNIPTAQISRSGTLQLCTALTSKNYINKRNIHVVDGNNMI